MKIEHIQGNIGNLLMFQMSIFSEPEQGKSAFAGVLVCGSLIKLSVDVAEGSTDFFVRFILVTCA